MQLFRTKPIETILGESKEEGEATLKRTLGVTALTLLGVGAVIGTGIFVLTGQAAGKHAGPAVVVSMIVAGIMSRSCRFMLFGIRIFGRVRLGLYLRLCNIGRVCRLDHRLGPDSRIRIRRGNGHYQVVRQHDQPAGELRYLFSRFPERRHPALVLCS